MSILILNTKEKKKENTLYNIIFKNKLQLILLIQIWMIKLNMDWNTIVHDINK